MQLRYFNPERGFWMYSKNYKRPLEEEGVRYDGKRVRLSPAAIIWRSRDGSSTKTITSDEARMDFNQSLGFSIKPDGEPLLVKFARLTGNVMIRDDRGTPNDPTDDLVIGPLTYVDYDDDALQIRSEAGVLIIDRDMRITGLGMLIQLRPKAQAAQNGAHVAGFEGAQSARLLGNVHIVFSDVGKTGILPGAMTTKRVGPNKVEVQARPDRKETGERTTAKTQDPPQPVPLDVRCEGPMQVDLPKPALPVKEGPPAPPAPTLVHFTRNVVVRRGKLDELPDQMDSDNLDLVLVPAAKAAQQNGKKRAGEAQAEKMSAPEGEAVEEKSMFGDLTLRRVKATGHAVWLQQPAQGTKVRCNELIHEVAALGGQGQNVTYLRADETRKLWLEKFDFVDDRAGGPDGPVVRKVQSVTHVWTMDATIFDDGDMDHSTLVARGPGLLETRPGPSDADTPNQEVPPDRTATWQDQLVLKNELGSDKKIMQKILILKGQPRIIDRLQASSLDAVDTIVAWLKPKTAENSRLDTSASPASASRTSENSKAQGGNFQIERLLALRDAHLVAPSKNLTARQRLDADFFEAPKPVVVTRSTAAPATAPVPATATASTAATPEPEAPAAAATDSTQETTQEKKPQPNMVVLADRVKAKVLIGPADPAKGISTTSASKTPGLGRVAGSGAPESTYEVREVRLFGGVSFHQDPAPGKTKGEDATGEVLVLFNDGPGQAIFHLYHRDATDPRVAAEPTRRWPRARITSEEMDIEGEGEIGLNQKTDQAWVHGPGRLVQLTDRGLLTDKTEETEPEAQNPEQNGNENKVLNKASALKAVKPKPKTRAGKVQTTKVPLTITWAEKMFFNGRSTDPENRPAAEAVFYKNVLAKMEDSLLYCTKTMTTYTDQPVPLADLGNMSKSGTAGKAQEMNGQDLDEEQAAQPEKPKPDLAFIDCVGNAVAISRKVDPDRPVLLNLQRLVADRLIYDRRTGNFFAPTPGIAYLYDQNKDANKPQERTTEDPIANRRPIKPTSGPPSDRRPGAKPGTRAAGQSGTARDASGKNQRQASAENKKTVLPLILTQIRFAKEMQGRFGTGKETDKNEPRWAEFFTNVEAARGPVANERTIFDYDRLPQDCYFLTSQMMRVVTEPPPPGAPENSPSRNFLKAWDEANARTKDTTIAADVITYDSQNDLIYAKGEDGRLVQIAQQTAPGQPGSLSRAESVRVNPKTGAANVAAPNVIQMLEAKTGARPQPVPPPDPNAKPPKRPKPSYRTPRSSTERRGFTGT